MKDSASNGTIPEWLTVARRDWVRIGRMLEDDDPWGAGFFLQQSLEKYIKAFLLSKGWKLKKIHELDALLDMAVEHKTQLSEFLPLCERVTDYYLLERYPPVRDAELTVSQVEDDVEDARRLIHALFPDEVV